MKQACIFSGSSHRGLADAVSERLGKHLDSVLLQKFSNGETSVEIKTSVRDQDVFIVQSGSSSINDAVMELLIMINACKGGSSRSITAVMPYFPYSRQSKRKGHRGSITARMVANLMHVAGVDHVITIDLHATQSQGFFRCPVDNLNAEPLLAKWVKANVKNWQDAVVVSKNPGGTVRVTSLADALKLSFGIVTTDCRRSRPPNSLESSMVLGSTAQNTPVHDSSKGRLPTVSSMYLPDAGASREVVISPIKKPMEKSEDMTQSMIFGRTRPISTMRQQTQHRQNGHNVSSPLVKCSHPGSSDDGQEFGIPPPALGSEASVSSDDHESIIPHERYDSEMDSEDRDYADERARDVVRGRLIGGHLVADDYPSPAISAMCMIPEQRHEEETVPDHMLSSVTSISSRKDHNIDSMLGGTKDAEASDDDEEQTGQDAELETTITLVGNVRGRPVFIVDDIIDKAGSWIAAAETVVKKGGATEVYCMASHGLFGDDSLAEMQACDEIERIVVTNSFPLPDEKRRGVTKLVELDVSALLSEAIRRNHYGEANSQLYHSRD